MRLDLLVGKTQASEFIHFTGKQLVPKSLLEKRERRQQEYFKENVIIHDSTDVQVVYKTHKGEEARAHPLYQTEASETLMEPFPAQQHHSAFRSEQQTHDLEKMDLAKGARESG